MATVNAARPPVVEELGAIVSPLRDNGVEAEKRGWIPERTIELLERAQVFRVAVPARFGGLDLPLREQLDIVAEVARGCGSTGWVTCAWVSCAWIAGLYPDRTQREVFRDGAVRISGGFTPSGTAVPVEGGYLLNGQWRFNTGCRGAHWNINAAIVPRPGGPDGQVFALVPMSDLVIADDWDVTGAAATGSYSTVAKDVFVPAHRVIDGAEALAGTTGDRPNTGANGRNYALIPYVMAMSVPVYIGLARAALELFLERVPGRAIAYSSWADQREHPYTQIQTATAANKITAAESMAAGWTELLQRRADAGEQPTPAERVEIRGQIGYAVRLCKEAVEVLYAISGASVIHRTAPLQRVYRDIQALSMHGLMSPVGNFEVHGRALLGLDPGSPYL